MIEEATPSRGACVAADQREQYGGPREMGVAVADRTPRGLGIGMFWWEVPESVTTSC